MSAERWVVSLATGDRPHFAAGLERLGQGLRRVRFDGRFRRWPPGNYPAACPAQLDVPFAFKPYCLVEAREAGARLVLWLDSTCVPVRSLDGIFARLERTGYLLCRNAQLRVGEWAGDAALDRFGVTRERALDLPEVNAAALGLDLANPVGAGFLERWYREAQHGVAFRGVEEPLRGRADYEAVKWNSGGRVSAHPRVRGHRHDQTVAGLLAHELGLELTGSVLRSATRLPHVPVRVTVVNLRGSRRRRLPWAR